MGFLEVISLEDTMSKRQGEFLEQVALTCGYGDQTAFTRQFGATVGLPPSVYRDHSARHV